MASRVDYLRVKIRWKIWKFEGKWMKAKGQANWRNYDAVATPQVGAQKRNKRAQTPSTPADVHPK